MTEHQLDDSQYRIERDSLGDYPVPLHALYGVHTARAVANFPISGMIIGDLPELIAALARIKKAACQVNADQGLLPQQLVDPIVRACDIQFVTIPDSNGVRRVAVIQISVDSNAPGWGGASIGEACGELLQAPGN